MLQVTLLLADLPRRRCPRQTHLVDTCATDPSSLRNEFSSAALTCLNLRQGSRKENRAFKFDQPLVVCRSQSLYDESLIKRERNIGY